MVVAVGVDSSISLGVRRVRSMLVDATRPGRDHVARLARLDL